MRTLYRFDEAAEKLFAGDAEALRQAVVLGRERALIELHCMAPWAFWGEEDDVTTLPASGENERARWRNTTKDHELIGWFYVSAEQAGKIAHGRAVSGLYVCPDLEDEHFLGLVFYVARTVELSDLWFECVAQPPRLDCPEDEALQYMAAEVASLTEDRSTVIRFGAAANVGMEGLDPAAFKKLVSDFDELQTLAIVKAAMKSARQGQSKGGRAKAAKNEPKRAAVREAWEACDKRGRGTKEAFKTAQAMKHNVSPRTIENWLK